MARGKPIDNTVRRRVVELQRDGLSEREIGRQLNLPKSTVHCIIKHHQNTGTTEPGKAPGRKRLLSVRDLRIFRRYIQTNNHVSVAELRLWTRERFHIEVSTRTIRRYLQRCGYRVYKAKRKPFLSTLNKGNRLRWARMYRGWTFRQWNRVLWTDESIFNVVYGKIRKTVICRKEEQNEAKCYARRVQKPASVMVWGCMTASGVGPLHVCEGIVNAHAYTRILERHLPTVRRHLFHRRRLIFQHDNARPHTARLTREWLTRHHVRTLPWPPSSPDLSPIENVWRVLKRRVQQRGPTTVAALIACLQEEWHRIDVEYLERLVRSMPRRIATVIRRRGGVTPW